MIKTFNIIKAKQSDNTKLPTHVISTKMGEGFVNIGACWTKDMKNGAKFLSCKLSDVWVSTKDNTKSQKSYVIVAEEEIVLPKIEDIRAIDENGNDLNEDRPF